MQYIVKAEEMRKYEDYTINWIGMPAMLLMERAALEAVNALEPVLQKNGRIIVFAGNGNNGGDGLAMGRILAARGFDVTFYMPEENGNRSAENEKQVSILQNLGFSILSKLPRNEYDIVIDSLLGSGLSRAVTEDYLRAVRRINQLKKKGAFVLAVDIPSGVHADTGAVLGEAVCADKTVAFSYAKAGHYLYPGREYCGELVIRDIGIVGRELKEQKPTFFSFDRREMKELLPPRNPAGNKGNFGKVLVVAGSVNMAGACILCAKAALRCGAGMVKVITPQANRSIMQRTVPEALLYTYGKEPNAKIVKEALEWADVVVAGSGLSMSETAGKLIKLVLKNGKKPLVLDADGLNLVAQDEALKALIKAYEKNKMILTPHPGEFARMAEISIEEYKEFPEKYVKELAREYGQIVAGKDAVTLVANAEGESIYMNLTGNDGMATAGSGDVLAGIIGGMLTCLDAFEAACIGVCLHGCTGEEAALHRGNRSVIASDLVEEIGNVLL